MDKCQVKGCNNESTHIYITHEDIYHRGEGENEHHMCEGCVNKYLRETNRDLLDKIKFNIYWLRQQVAVAKEAKARKWSYEGMDPQFRHTSPGGLYEYHMNTIPKLMAETEQLIKTLEERNVK